MHRLSCAIIVLGLGMAGMPSAFAGSEPDSKNPNAQSPDRDSIVVPVPVLAPIPFKGVLSPFGRPDVLQSESPYVKNMLRSMDESKVAAKVNGECIFQDEILRMLLPRIVSWKSASEGAKLSKGTFITVDGAKLLKEMFTAVREEFIDRELLYQEAVRVLRTHNPEGLEKTEKIQRDTFDEGMRAIKEKNKLTDDQVTRELRRCGMTLERMKRLERRKFFADEFLRSLVEPILPREAADRKKRNDLRAAVFEREAKRIIQELRANAVIELNEDSYPSLSAR